MLGGLLIIGLVVHCLNLEFLKLVARTDVARGLLAFLFAIAPVGVALITALAAVLSISNTDEITARFQMGKDVLMVLIGVLSAILGFYSGSEAGRQPESTPVRDQPVSTASPTVGTNEAPPVSVEPS